MRGDALHQPFRKPTSTMGFAAEDVGEAGESRAIGDDTRKADLLALIEDSKTKRILDRPRKRLAGNARRPVAVRQERMDEVEVKSRGVGGDLELFSMPIQPSH